MSARRPPSQYSIKATRFERGVRRADRRIGTMYLRGAGWLFLLLGIGALVSIAYVFPEDPLSGWPVLIAAGFFLAFARWCFASRLRMSDALDESSRLHRR